MLQPQRRPFESPVDVLVVEDEADVRETLAELLEGEGYTVAAVEGGAEALAFLRAHAPPTMIIADLMMPGMNAVEMMAELATLEKVRDVPVVVFTAASESYIAASGVVASLVVRKPDVDTLLERVARVTRRGPRAV